MPVTADADHRLIALRCVRDGCVPLSCLHHVHGGRTRVGCPRQAGPCLARDRTALPRLQSLQQAHGVDATRKHRQSWGFNSSEALDDTFTTGSATQGRGLRRRAYPAGHRARSTPEQFVSRGADWHSSTGLAHGSTCAPARPNRRGHAASIARGRPDWSQSRRSNSELGLAG